jgi:hypothetical protein
LGNYLGGHNGERLYLEFQFVAENNGPPFAAGPLFFCPIGPYGISPCFMSGAPDIIYQFPFPAAGPYLKISILNEPNGIDATVTTYLYGYK